MVKDILGPRNGPSELLPAKENPLNEYLTGVLIPAKQNSDLQEKNAEEVELIGSEEGSDELEDTSDDKVGEIPVFSPALDPKRKPSSIGITFSVESIELNLRVCITWGEYKNVTMDGNSYYQRYPRAKVVQISPDSHKKYIKISKEKEIYLLCLINEIKSEKKLKRISLFIVNQIEPKNRDKTEVWDTIFQPQIRIRLGNTSRLADETNKFNNNSEDSELALLYEHRNFNVKGHLCSVVLKEFDPQIIGEQFASRYAKDALESPAFKWIDGIPSNDLTKTDIIEFSEPDLRTDFVPIYSVPGPQYEIFDESGNSINFSAVDLSQKWNPEDLKRRINPMLVSFERWIKSNQKETSSRPEQEKKILSRISDEATISLNRMKKGLDLLLTDEQARLAFCLTNKAMEIQYSWNKKDEDLKWRPFQIAYFLLTIESISNPNSKDREICDLLWVATGGGKTEAYLAIMAFTIILRRLKGHKSPYEGFGTSVIIRYTLRLLAIQQFRRALSLITAIEYLRVLENDKNQYGWRPSAYTGNDKYLLGSIPFTIGLWVGGGVTPNRLEGSEYTAEGAIDILKKHPDQSNSSEPAQVTTCPACGTILSISADGLEKGKHVMHIIFKADFNKLNQNVSVCTGNYNKVYLNSLKLKENSNKTYSTLNFEFETSEQLTIAELDNFLNKVVTKLKKFDPNLDVASSHITRPGYFFRTYINKKKKAHEYNFELYCPNPDCPLTVKWFAGTPNGMIHNKSVEEFLDTRKILLGGSLNLKEIIDPFQADATPYYSDRIQIPAMTTDDQIYMDPPTILLSTVDKFARPAFEPRSASIFGNFDFYHSIYGYYRESLHGKGNEKHPSPVGGKRQIYVKIDKASPPDLILQDELHLIEGPLGSMVGIYETAVDYLISEVNGMKPKYIASTATIRNAKDQIKAVFTRNVQLFPPFGNNSDDRFFIKESEIQALDDVQPGRLYLGIAAPGRGPLTPIYRIWARLLQTGWNNRENPEVDRFWTVTGYFNSIRELAGAVALYRQDIPQQLHIIGRGDSRPVPDDRKVELSSRINSTELPTILEVLNRNYVPESANAIDALFTTSMFGTGIDVSRLGLMFVNGQPKTTSSYIQSTGRIGRSQGGLVVTFLRASRPRDLSHYEYFTKYHRQLHRFVEPVSAYPFAPRVMERALGPVSVFILRNTRLDKSQWYLDKNAGRMPQLMHSSTTINNLRDIFETRAQSQPSIKKPSPGLTSEKVMEKIDTWEQENIISAGKAKPVKYAEYFKAEHDVVLGDSLHKLSKDVSTVYDDAPQSLRDIEETTSFET